ncbi:hypothetical protein [Nocardia fusca]|uniref:Methyltransferase family protein n=1 Tax=Nocardia fusca TaxID=941183 RepID=A0ABV3FAD4_9NOCA
MRSDEKGIAFDLGCGPGTRALALARLGFTRVTAVGTSAVLLDELTRFAAEGGVEPIVRPVQPDIRGALPALADPLHTRRDGPWTLTTDSYPKLPLPHRWLNAQCRAAGPDIAHDDTGPGGLRVLHAVEH